MKTEKQDYLVNEEVITGLQAAIARAEEIFATSGVVVAVEVVMVE